MNISNCCRDSNINSCLGRKFLFNKKNNSFHYHCFFQVDILIVYLGDIRKRFINIRKSTLQILGSLAINTMTFTYSNIPGVYWWYNKISKMKILKRFELIKFGVIYVLCQNNWLKIKNHWDLFNIFYFKISLIYFSRVFCCKTQHL